MLLQMEVWIITGSLHIKNDIYHVVLNYKDETGKRKQRWISTKLAAKGNKRKAEQILETLKRELEENITQNRNTRTTSHILFPDFMSKRLDL